MQDIKASSDIPEDEESTDSENTGADPVVAGKPSGAGKVKPTAGNPKKFENDPDDPSNPNEEREQYLRKLRQ